MLLRSGVNAHPQWLAAYCQSLADAAPAGILRRLLFWSLPFLAAVAAGLLPGTKKLLLGLAALRGVLLGYALAACYVSGVEPTGLLARSCCLLSLFYLFCRSIRLSSAGRNQ